MRGSAGFEGRASEERSEAAGGAVDSRRRRPWVRAARENSGQFPVVEPVEQRPPIPAEQSWPRTETPSLRRDAALVDTGVQSLQHEEFDDEASLVRPYAWTRGRTKSSLDLELETLVSTRDQAEIPRMTQLEHRSIAQLCRHPHSVAEVAAKLHVPLGVARVLLSDMAEVGLIIVHQTVADNDMAAHLILMERVLSGLRRL